MPITIAFAEDNAVNRNTLQQKIRDHKELSLIFGAVDGHDFLEQLKRLPFAQHPKVAFIDIEMPNMDGIQTIQIAKSLYPHIQFIILTIFDDDDKIYEAIRAGAIGYLLKDETSDSLYNAISCVMDNAGAAMSPTIARKAFELLSNANVNLERKKGAEEMDSILSQREREILQQTIKGYGAAEVAEILDISVLTVRRHIANIYLKLHVTSKAQVIHLAHKRKWNIF
jgi:DNA-binding NarL/FixJ family response regulator